MSHNKPNNGVPSGSSTGPDNEPATPTSGANWGGTSSGSNPPVVPPAPTVPQSEDYRIFPQTGAPLLVLSVLDDSLPTFATNLNHDLSIYTENLLLERSFTTSGNNLETFTHSVTVVPSDDGTPRAMDVSGPDGKPVPPMVIVGTPKDGNDGTKAGKLRFVVEDLGSDSALDSLTFDAHGGSGSDGQATVHDSAGGNGGNGADAGDAQIWVGGSYSATIVRLSVIYQDMTATPPKPTASADLKKAIASIRNNQPFMALDDLPQRLDKVDTALRTNTITDLKPALQDLALRFMREGDALVGTIQPKVNVQGGRYGGGGEGKTARGANGNLGKAGTFHVDFFSGDSTYLRASDILVAHPDQCRMLFEKAKARYFLDDIQSTVDCRTLLSRLQVRLFFLKYLQPDDKLYASYAAAESRLCIPPAAPPAVGKSVPEINSIASMRQLQTEVNALARQIDNGLDYYGNPANYAPMLSYNSYQSLTTALLAAANDAEVAYAKYAAADATQQQRQVALRSMMDQCDLQVKNCGDTIELLKGDIRSTAVAVAALDGPMKDARQHMHERIEKDKDIIDKSFNLFHMSFGDIVDSLAMVMFCPKAPMAVAQGAKILWEAGTELPDGTGKLVQKSYLVNQISQIEATTDALDEGLKARDDGPDVQIDDPGASKLIAARDDMMNLLKQYSGVLGENNLEETLQAFNDYINLVDQRNTAVMHYNACVNLWYTNQQQQQYYQAQRNTLSDTAIDTIDPSLPAVSVYMQKAYTDAVAAVMQALYRTQRSYRFAALTTASPLSASLQGSPLNAIRHADLARAQAAILTAYSGALEAAGRDPQDFHGVVCPLAAAEWRVLRAAGGGSTTFVTLRAPTSATAPAVSPFAGKADVRLTKVRLFVPGARTKSGMLTATLTHAGPETLVDTGDTAFPFYHAPITRSFSYRLSDGAFGSDVDGAMDGDIGDGNPSHVADAFALVGPFTTWSVSLAANEGLDLSQATGAYLKFDGKCFPFPST